MQMKLARERQAYEDTKFQLEELRRKIKRQKRLNKKQAITEKKLEPYLNRDF
jgi:hypothetical protein